MRRVAVCVAAGCLRPKSCVLRPRNPFCPPYTVRCCLARSRSLFPAVNTIWHELRQINFLARCCLHSHFIELNNTTTAAAVQDGQWRAKYSTTR
jgi:hypothetical protein